jgi:hypothetical protein
MTATIACDLCVAGDGKRLVVKYHIDWNFVGREDNHVD